MAVVFVGVMAGVITWLVNKYLLVNFGIEFLRTITFILVIAALVQFVEMFLKKHPWALRRAWDISATDYNQLRGYGPMPD